MAKKIASEPGKKIKTVNGGYVFLIMLLVFFVVLALGMLFQYLVNKNIGSLDKTFGIEGKVQLDINSSIDKVSGIVEQKDGKIIVIGTYSVSSNTAENVDILLARFNAAGSLDVEFGENGIKIIDLGGMDMGIAVNLQANEKIVTANRSCKSENNNCEAVLIRLNQDGTIDKTFGDAGKQILEIGDLFYNAPHRLLVGPTDNIVLAGSWWNGQDFDFAVYLADKDGSPYTENGVNGLITVGFGDGKLDIATDLTFQGNKIVVVGRTCDSTSEDSCKIGLIRFTSDGKIDRSFGNNGIKTTKLNTSIIPQAIAKKKNGNFLVVGGRENRFSIFTVVQYKRNGSIDDKFSSKGKLTDSFIKDRDSWVDDIISQPDGKFVLMGISATNEETTNIVLRRYESDGTLDITFGRNGNLFIDFGRFDFASAILVTADGKFVIAGNSGDGEQTDIALSRILP